MVNESTMFPIKKHLLDRETKIIYNFKWFKKRHIEDSQEQVDKQQTILLGYGIKRQF